MVKHIKKLERRRNAALTKTLNCFMILIIVYAKCIL